MVATPVSPIPTLLGTGPAGPQSPETVRMMRDYAKALMTHQERKNPFYPWTMGVNDMLGDWLGALMLRRSSEAERARYAGADIDTTSPTSSTSPISPTSAPSAVPGGTASAAPFPDRPTTAGSSPASPPPPGTGVPSGDQASSTPSGDQSDKPIQVAALDPTSGIPSDASDKLSRDAINLSSMGETSKTGRKALFNISPDTKGSKSYGPFGLNSKSGSVADFVKNNPQFGLTAPPGTPEFDAQWRRAAAVQSDDFQKAHDAWHQKNIMNGLPESMIRAGIDPKIANDPRVQKYMADRKVQMNTVGLRQALASAQGSSTPEEFLNAVSTTDKSRLPLNFRSYLADHPNNVRGLNNRIDLRHSAALAAADPELTGKMVASYRGDTAADAPPPTPSPETAAPVRVAGEGVTSLPRGDLAEQWKSAYHRMIMSGWPPDAAAEQADRLSRAMVGSKGMETGLMPQVHMNALGQVQIDEPGKAPRFLPGSVPGYPGQYTPSPKYPGAGFITRVDPTAPGGIRTQGIVPQFPGFTTSPSAAPNPFGGPGGSPPGPGTAPVEPGATPTGGDRGLLSSPAPKVGAPEVASLSPMVPSTAVLPPVKGDPREKLAEAVIDRSKSAPSSETAKNLPTTSPPDWTWKKSLFDAANQKPIAFGAGMEPPSIMQAYRDAATQGLDPLDLHESKVQAYEKGLESQASDQAKLMEKIYSDIHEAGSQAIKQLGPLKQTLHALENSEKLGVTTGPFSASETWIKSAKQNIGRIAKEWADSGGMPIPGIEKWSEGSGGDANQVLVKTLAARALEGLRGMLGSGSGQFRQYEMELMVKALGSAELSPGALYTVTQMIDKVNDRNVLLDRMASEWRAKVGSIDQRFVNAMNNYNLEHPVFTPDEFDKYSMSIDEGGVRPGETPVAKPAVKPAEKPDPLGIRK